MRDGHFFSLEGPLDSMPVERQMRAGNLSGFGELVRARGAEPRGMLERNDIDPLALRDPDLFIDTRAVAALLEDCSHAFNDPLFGLHMGALQNPDIFGCITTLCRSAATLRDALRCYTDYLPVVHCPSVTIEVVEGRETAELRWRVEADLGQADQAQFKGALTNLKLLRQLGGPSFKPSAVSLTVDVRQKDQGEIARLLGCAFHGRSTINSIAFPVALMNGSVASANRLLFRLLGGYLERVRNAARRSTVERVEDYVRGALPSGTCSIEHCAKRMGRSVRTLQVSLSENGLRFSDILEQQRIELAKIYLRQDELKLDDVAMMLGYAEQSSFGRAFKRWTGSTPQRFRHDSGAAPVSHH
jgi:AraC-like DNA-binding protein